MELIVGLAFVVVGLALLTFAADRFVLAAARLSRAFGLSPIIIGAVVLGIGTSAPEFLVGILAALRGSTELALGNAIGSNVANLTLVLGSAVLVSTTRGHLQTLRREGVLVMVSALVLTGLMWDGSLTRVEGAGLLVGLGVALGLMARWARADKAKAVEIEQELAELTDSTPVRVPVEAAFAIGSLVMTLIGAQSLIEGAVRVAREVGLSEAFIGLTLVAVGTSLPELATALAAARRREADLVVGNILGSNLFNTLGVVGGAALAGPGTFGATFDVTLIAMVVVTLLAGWLMATGDRLVRSEGLVLLVSYSVFLILSY